MPGREHRCAALGLMATLGIGFLVLAASQTQAQKRQKAPPVAKEAPHTQMQEVTREQQPGAKERKACRRDHIQSCHVAIPE